MLAMERLPPSQPFSTALPFPSPTIHSLRAVGAPPPLCIHGTPIMHPTAALHVSLHGHTAPKPGSLVHPQSGSNLPSVHTPPPYDHSTAAGMPLVPGGHVYSPTGAAHTVISEHEHHQHTAGSPRLGPPSSMPQLINASATSSSTSSTSSEVSTGSPPGECAEPVMHAFLFVLVYIHRAG